MFNTLKSVIILSLGLSITRISVEAVKIFIYGQSLTESEGFELSEIEKLLDSKYYRKYVCNKIIIHGFKGERNGRFVSNTTLAYILTNSTTCTCVNETSTNNTSNVNGTSVCNVLVLDWSAEASADPILGDEASYAMKVPQARLTGEQLADALAKISKLGFNVNCTHIIAHSLGAHLAGHCGRKLKIIYKLELLCIYGLDPSGPLYDGPLPADTPLKEDCAKFVFCHHCDPGNKGINSSYCHIDSWTNYGLFLSSNKTDHVQPDCPKGNFDTFSINGTCSHDYCWKQLVASLVDNFVDLFLMSFGTNWWQWARSNGTATPVKNFPAEIDTVLRGNYYFSASGTRPYGLREAGLWPVYDANITTG